MDKINVTIFKPGEKSDEIKTDDKWATCLIEMDFSEICSNFTHSMLDSIFHNYPFVKAYVKYNDKYE